MSFRFEKKYLLQNKEFLILKNSFLERNCKKLYPSRNINSLYFDSKYLNNYYDSEEGTLPRIKIRIRNYDKLKKYYKEIKISSYEGRFKISKELSKDIYEKFESSLFYNGKKYFPYVYTNYKRSYFSYSNLRITVDTNILYQNYHNKKVYYDNNIVLELKSKDHIDYTHNIYSKLKFSDIRYSKYNNAINNVSCLV